MLTSYIRLLKTLQKENLLRFQQNYEKNLIFNIINHNSLGRHIKEMSEVRITILHLHLQEKILCLNKQLKEPIKSLILKLSNNHKRHFMLIIIKIVMLEVRKDQSLKRMPRNFIAQICQLKDKSK